MTKVFESNFDVEKALNQEGLTISDYQEICRRLNRAPNRTELGMFGVMWSEHCCYRNSKPLLSTFPTKGPNILVGPGENAGVVDLGCNQKLAFKIESHNHPSAVEPFQGAATGVGGILRDIFTMGARPIAVLNALRFGPLEEKTNIDLIKGVVAGIAHYGNCVGVPNVGGEVSFDSSYSGNPLVNAMAIGLLETEDIVCSGAKGVGNSVIYVGSTTGRDGMGGASFASAELTDKSLEDRPAVQVGDPFLEKGLIEACLEVFKEGDVLSAQDMGAAGLTCSCSEMASKGGVGIELDLDLVPSREDNMSPYEYLLSESQERMLFVVKPGKENRVMDKFIRWGLKAAVVGKVLEENIVKVIHKGQIVANIPASALAEDTPIEKHLVLNDIPLYIQSHWKWNEGFLELPTNTGVIIGNDRSELSWNNVLIKLLDSPNISSKSWIYKQYDHQVQGNTILNPGIADAAVIRLRSQLDFLNSDERALAAVVDCPNRWVYLDPERGAMASVVESFRNITCVGGKPLAITDNLNFSSPKNPEGYWQFSSACKGISQACLALNTPVTGGNVSLYNETRLPDGTIQPIHPTPVIGMVGLIENINHSTSIPWKNIDDSIWLIGVSFDSFENLDPRITLSATSYLEYIHNKISGRPPEIDLDYDIIVQHFLLQSIKSNLISSAHDLGDGGLAVALAECTIKSNYGADIYINEINQRIDRILFSEGGPRYLVSVSIENESLWRKKLSNRKVDSYFLGKVINEPKLNISLNDSKLIDISSQKLSECYENAIPCRINE